jgi:hypothetical protein
MRFVVGLAAAAMALWGCNRAPAEPRVTAEDVVLTLPAISGRPGAAYFKLRTNRSRPRSSASPARSSSASSSITR